MQSKRKIVILFTIIKMDISQLTLKIMILLIPGGIGSIILERLTVHKPWSAFKFVINAIIIGVFSYLLLQLVTLFLFKGSTLSIWESINEPTKIPYKEVIFSSCCGIIIGLLITAADTNKWLNRITPKYHGFGGIKENIVNGLHYSGKPRRISWPAQMIKEGIDALDVYWLVTHGDNHKDCPREIKKLILNIYTDVHGRLPRGIWLYDSSRSSEKYFQIILI